MRLPQNEVEPWQSRAISLNLENRDQSSRRPRELKHEGQSARKRALEIHLKVTLGPLLNIQLYMDKMILQEANFLGSVNQKLTCNQIEWRDLAERPEYLPETPEGAVLSE